MSWNGTLELLGAEAPSERGILVRVKNPSALAARQGGGGGAAAAALADAFPQIAARPLESLVLDKLVEQLRTNLKAAGADADVSLVAPASYRPPAAAPRVAAAAAVGAVLGAAAGWALKKRGAAL